MVSSTPQETIANTPMSPAQNVLIFLCVMLYALDGFDVLAISFAAPGIAEEWGIDRAALGIVLSMELFGMSMGSIVLGSSADRYGRQTIIVFSLMIITVGMFLASTADGIYSLSFYRYFTGLGIGGLLAAVAAVVAEFSSSKRKGLTSALMTAGFSFGAVVGGSIATQLLPNFGWRSVFVFGAVATFAFIPLVIWFVPEPVHYLIQKRPENALEKINRTLRRIGKEPINKLPQVLASPNKKKLNNWLQLFKPGLALITTLLTIAYFGHIITYYFILKWTPKIVVDMGYDASTAGSVLVWANVGGFMGAICMGLFSQKYPIIKLSVIMLFMSAIMVSLFGQVVTNLTWLSVIATIAGFCTTSVLASFYAIVPNAFPTSVRVGGTGFVIGAGRGGAALSPIIAGILFAAHFELPTVAILMTLGSLLASCALILYSKVTC